MQQRVPGAARTGRQVVISYRNYADAQRAVDWLADQKFAVERVAIVAEGLRLVEQITGRLTIGTVILQGAINGAVTGALFGLLIGLFSLGGTTAAAGLALTLYGLFIGALIGAAVSAVLHLATGGRRDFSSAGGIQADRYDVMVDDEVADDARRLLERMPNP